MHEPVAVERCGELFLPTEDRAPAVNAVTRHGLDTKEPATLIGSGELDGAITGLVVDQVDAQPLADEMLEAPADEPLLVVGRKQGDDVHVRQLRLPVQEESSLLGVWDEGATARA